MHRGKLVRTHFDQMSSTAMIATKNLKQQFEQSYFYIPHLQANKRVDIKFCSISTFDLVSYYIGTIIAHTAVVLRIHPVKLLV